MVIHTLLSLSLIFSELSSASLVDDFTDVLDENDEVFGIQIVELTQKLEKLSLLDFVLDRVLVQSQLENRTEVEEIGQSEENWLLDHLLEELLLLHRQVHLLVEVQNDQQIHQDFAVLNDVQEVAVLFPFALLAHHVRVVFLVVPLVVHQPLVFEDEELFLFVELVVPQEFSLQVPYFSLLLHFFFLLLEAQVLVS